MQRNSSLTATLDDNVPLTSQVADQFANDLHSYLEKVRNRHLKTAGIKVSSVEFQWAAGDKVLRAFVKTETHRNGRVVDVFEDIGGPEVRLVVNGVVCSTWMLGCDHFDDDILRTYSEETMQVVELMLTKTWEFRNVKLCCQKWEGVEDAIVECCTKPKSPRQSTKHHKLH